MCKLSKKDESFLPPTMKFQWHVTDKCNYRCKHCYQENYRDNGVSFDEQIRFLNQMEEFVFVSKEQNGKAKAHINLTGGEPFLRDDFLDLLNVVKQKNFTFGILSNGFLLPDEKLQELKKLKPEFIQISLEGNERINNSIRGKGSFEDVKRALKKYYQLKIPTIISFTANSENYKHFSSVIKIARKYKAAKVWTDRYLPINRNDNLLMGTEEVQDFFQIIYKEQKKNKRHFFSKTQVSANRALQFLTCGGMAYKCSAGKTLLAILPNGDIMPCRRLPMIIGNLKENNLIDLYKNNKTLQELRKQEIPEGCEKCFYKNTCNGGLKCLSYALCEKINIKDPNCWL